MALPEEQVANIIASGDPEKPTPGDTYDCDSGEFLGNLTDGNGDQIVAPPSSVEIFVAGFWYVYKMDSRTQHIMIGDKDGSEKTA